MEPQITPANPPTVEQPQLIDDAHDPIGAVAKARQAGPTDAEVEAAFSKNLGAQPTASQAPAPAQPTEEVQGVSTNDLILKKMGAYATQAAGGALDAVQNTWNTVVDLADWGEDYLASQGMGPGDLVERARTNFATQLIPPSTSLDEQIVRGVSNFVLPFAGWSKLLGVAGAATKGQLVLRGMGAGAVTDFSAFDPKGGRIADLLNQVPVLKSVVPDYLVSKDDDTKLEGRLKNTIEGLGLGAMSEGLFLSVKAYKSYRNAAQATKNELRGVQPPPPPAKLDPKAKPEKPLDLTPLAPEGGSPVSFGRRTTPEQAKALAEGLQAEKVVPPRVLNINLTKFDNIEDVDKVINEVVVAFKGEAEGARRGVMSDKLIDELGDMLSVNSADLLKKGVGSAYNAEQLDALMKIMVAGSKDLKSKAKAALNGGMVEEVALQQSADVMRALTAKASGAVAEAGRAFRRLRVYNHLKVGQEAEILKTLLGGTDMRALAKEIVKIDDPKRLIQAVQRTKFEKLIDGLRFVQINGLLSGPTTHIKNFIGNTVGTLAPVAEDAITAGIGKLRGRPGTERVFYGEAGAQLHAMLESVGEAFTAAKEAFRTGESSFGGLQKFGPEFQRSVKEGGEQATNLWSSGWENFKGFMSLPTRALTGSDEFFKTLNYRMSLKKQSIHQAELADLTGREFGENVSRLREVPMSEMMDQAVIDAHEKTFTAPLEGWFESADTLVRRMPAVRLAIPFMRTNLNLVKFTVERSPFAPLFKSVLADLAAGGLRQDKALSKIALGSMAMGSGLFLVSQGKLIGRNHQDPSKRYSIKLGDTHFKLPETDPAFWALTMAADLAEIGSAIQASHPHEYEELALTSAALLADRLTPSFLVDSMASILGAVQGDEREGVKLLSNVGSSFIPYSGMLRTINKFVDPVKRDVRPDPNAPSQVWDMIQNKARALIPTRSNGMPAQVNIFGEEIVSPAGYGWDVLSPFFRTKASDSPAMKEIERLGLGNPIFTPEETPENEHLIIKMPPRSIRLDDGKAYKMNPEEYETFAKLAAGHGLPGRGLTVEQLINRQITHNWPELGPFKNDESKKVWIAGQFRQYQKEARDHFKNILQRGSGGREMRREKLDKEKRRMKALKKRPEGSVVVQ